MCRSESEQDTLFKQTLLWMKQEMEIFGKPDCWGEHTPYQPGEVMQTVHIMLHSGIKFSEII